MLDLDVIREQPDRVKQAIREKDAGTPELVDRLLEVDERRRAALTDLQQARHESNTSSKRIGELMRKDKQEEAREIIERNKNLKQEIQTLEQTVETLEAKQDELVLEIPNLPHSSVPVGHSPDENEIVDTWGDPGKFSFSPAPHWELIEEHDLVDFDRGAKVTGAGFPVYVGKGARLQRALVRFFLDLAIDEHGYTEVHPPYLVNAASASGTGQLPDKEDLMYEVPRDELYLIPTAEVPVTNLLRDEIIPEDDLPIKYCAYTPCFRREAGSYGKDVRGLNRIHQFDKVELVQFVHPDESYNALERLREAAETALQKLELPYRCLLMCTGDMGFTQAKKYDLEVWSAGQERWLEVSSISNFEAFQAKRAMIRYRDEETDNPAVLHTLNGSGLALPRVVAALLEHNQRADGTIDIPEILRPYTGFERIA
jgi:seryl-tRNA synthetase